MKALPLAILALFLGMGVLSVSAKEKTPVRALLGEDGVQRAEVVGGDYFFKPDHIIVLVNVPVELKVRKEGGIVPHSFVLKAPEAGIALSDSLDTEPRVLRFTPAKTGKYPFYCDKKLLFFKSHKERGMEGVLEVVE